MVAAPHREHHHGDGVAVRSVTWLHEGAAEPGSPTLPPRPATTGTAVTDGSYQIGAVAERVGLSLGSVRHYEEVGPVTPSDRTPRGFRLYAAQELTPRLERDLHANTR